MPSHRLDRQMPSNPTMKIIFATSILVSLTFAEDSDTNLSTSDEEFEEKFQKALVETIQLEIGKEFKIQQDEINKLRRLIECYHGIAKPVVYVGTAGASSSWSAKYGPQNAFENSDDRWASGRLGDGSRRTELYFNFTSEVTVAMIGLVIPPNSDYAWDQAPKSFELIASMDCSDWHVLLNVVDHIWSHSNEEFIWKIPCDLIKPWKCYGIRATAHSGSSYDCVTVKEMKMYTMQGWQKTPDIDITRYTPILL